MAAMIAGLSRCGAAISRTSTTGPPSRATPTSSCASPVHLERTARRSTSSFSFAQRSQPHADEAQGGRVLYRAQPAVLAELLTRLLQVKAHGRNRQTQDRADLFVRLARRCKLETLNLATREPVEANARLAMRRRIAGRNEAQRHDVQVRRMLFEHRADIECVLVRCPHDRADDTARQMDRRDDRCADAQIRAGALF